MLKLIFSGILESVCGQIYSAFGNLVLGIADRVYDISTEYDKDNLASSFSLTLVASQEV